MQALYIFCAIRFSNSSRNASILKIIYCNIYIQKNSLSKCKNYINLSLQKKILYILFNNFKFLKFRIY